jgi:hypothetical protein
MWLRPAAKPANAVLDGPLEDGIGREADGIVSVVSTFGT